MENIADAFGATANVEVNNLRDRGTHRGRMVSVHPGAAQMPATFVTTSTASTTRDVGFLVHQIGRMVGVLSGAVQMLATFATTSTVSTTRDVGFLVHPRDHHGSMVFVQMKDVLTNVIFVKTNIVSIMKRLLVVKAAIAAMDNETAMSVNIGVPNIILALRIMNSGMNQYQKRAVYLAPPEFFFLLDFLLPQSQILLRLTYFILS